MNSSDTKSTSDIRDFFVKRKRSDEVENSSAGLNKASSEDNSFETDPSSPVKKKLKMSNSAYKPKPKRFKQNEDVFRVRMASDASTDSEITFNKSNTTEVSRNMGPQEFSDESDSDDAIKPKSTKKPEVSEKSESSENESDEEEYEVEAILDYKWCLATTQGLYFVKWLGWDDSQNTWEPLSNLTTCDEKLRQFYTKRVADREAAPSAKKRYFEVPPDPRTNFERRSELADRICPPPCQSELEAFYDRLKTHPVKQWKQEVINKCFDQLEKSKGANEKKKTMVREQIMLKHVLGKRKEQQQRLKEWEKEINAISGDVAKITVENEADLEGPPRQLNFIRESKPSEGIIIPDDPLIGCDCQNCDIKADKDCCPSMNGVVHFPYTKYGKLRIAVGVPIYECNKLCKCDASCANRVVQKGRKVKLCIYRTDNGCGWGVKTLENIRKGSFVVEYVGEVITSEEAEERGKKYDAEGRTYLFDLDFNKGQENPYTVDAAHYGNVSHFINHSCDPNLAVFNVWIDCLDPDLPRLALFAVRDIVKGEQLTFDYRQRTSDEEPSVEADPDKTEEGGMECKCGSRKCRKIMFH